MDSARTGISAGALEAPSLETQASFGAIASPRLCKSSCARLALGKCWLRLLVNWKDGYRFPDTFCTFCHQEDVMRELIPLRLGRSLPTPWNAPESSAGSPPHSASSYVNYLRSSVCLGFSFPIQKRKARMCVMLTTNALLKNISIVFYFEEAKEKNIC